MSRNAKNVSVKSAAPIQKYCKVCQDAGKSEAEYRSHFTRETRDPNSKVVCPTLLALECRYCFKNGHTVKYCDILKRNQKEQKREEQNQARRAATEAVKPKGKSKVSSNPFMCLDESSEDEEETKPVVKEEFPTLCVPVSRTQSSAANYAAALAKPAAPAPKVMPVVTPAAAVAAPAPKVSTAKAAPWASESKAAKLNWAAWDSDSDEEEDDLDDCDPYKPYAFGVAEEEETYTDAW